MEKKEFYRLNTDPLFRCLIRPLYKNEFVRLEVDIIKNGCVNPILTWKGLIIDGHNRYNICLKNNIPFSIEKLEFDSREEVISWICARQLIRKNLPEEQRRYLIGMQYESEKKINGRKNLYRSKTEEQGCGSSDLPYEIFEPNTCKVLSGHITALRIGKENNISWNTVYKYYVYARAIEQIRQKVPAVIPQILSGKYKISHANVVELSKMKSDQIRKIAERIECNQMNFGHFKNTRKQIIESRDSEKNKKGVNKR